MRAIFALIALLAPAPALAHVSQQAFVLLLPTGVYSLAGVAVVALTVLAMGALPKGALARAFAPRALWRGGRARGEMLTSLAGMAIFWALVWVGLTGPRDPLTNLVPVTVWTIWWIGLVTLAAFAGDIWRWVNPWSGFYILLRGARPAPFRLPGWVGRWPSVAGLAGFAAFYLADTAPDDPARLAVMLAGYWVATFIGMLLFGARAWLSRAEMVSVLFAAYADLAPLARGRVGAPGWRLLRRRATLSGGAFALVLLANGSFDGVNETFWWLAQIGVNPLEFPGRSAVIAPTLLGLALSNLALFAVFAAAIWLGLVMIGAREAFGPAFARLALSLLPIALAYHIAHYLTAFLVGWQYALLALTDPLGTGADMLGIMPFQVSTGFFNHIDSVRAIWLGQAGAIVAGHVWAVLLAHRMAEEMFGEGRRATLATLPLSTFMVGYTFLGLWLLAAPRGA